MLHDVPTRPVGLTPIDGTGRMNTVFAFFRHAVITRGLVEREKTRQWETRSQAWTGLFGGMEVNARDAFGHWKGLEVGTLVFYKQAAPKSGSARGSPAAPCGAGLRRSTTRAAAGAGLLASPVCANCGAAKGKEKDILQRFSCPRKDSCGMEDTFVCGRDCQKECWAAHKRASPECRGKNLKKF